MPAIEHEQNIQATLTGLVEGLTDIWKYYGFDDKKAQLEVETIGMKADASKQQFETWSNIPTANPIIARRAGEIKRVFKGFLDLTLLQTNLREKAMGMAETDNLEVVKKQSDIGVMELGSRILINQRIEQLKKLGRQTGLPEAFFSYLVCSELERSAIVNIRFGNLSMKDFLEGRKPSARDRFRFFMVPWVLTESRFSNFDKQALFKETVAGNKQALGDEYPNLAINEILFTAMIINATLDVARMEIPLKRLSSSHEREAYESTASWCKAVLKTRDELYEILVNPKSTYYQELMEEILKYSPKPEGLVWAAHILRLFDEDSFVKKYRRLKELAEADSHRKVYEALAQFIEKYIVVENRKGWPQPLSDLTNLISEETANSQDSDEEAPNGEKPRRKLDEVFGNAEISYDLKTLGGLIQAANQSRERLKDRNLEFKIDPVKLSCWKVLERPSEIILALDPSAPQRKFTIAFYWQDEELGDDTSLSLKFDLKKKDFDWSFLDSPSNPDSSAVKSFLIDLSGRIADCFRETMLQKEREAAVASRNQKNSVPPTSTKIVTAVHYQDYVYQLRREARQQQETSLPFTKIGKESKQMLQRFPIRAPEGDAWENLLRDVPDSVKPAVLRVIRNHNQGGECVLKKLPYSFPGENLFSLRVGRKWRVLLRLSKDDNGGILIPVAVKHRTVAYS